MVCPKCGNEQPDVFSQCQKCRYIFPRPQASAPKGTAAAQHRTTASASTHPAAIVGGLLFVAAILGIVLWWLNSPEAQVPLEGSYTNTTYQFAIHPPADWMTLTSDNYEVLFDKLGDRFPKMLKQGLSNRNIEVGFIKILENAEFSPSVNVVVLKTSVPDLDEEQLAEGGRVLTDTYKQVLDDFSLEKSELITVDELTAARFTSKGSLKIRVEKPAEPSDPYSSESRSRRGSTTEWREFELRFVQTLIPGKGRGYIVTSSALATQFDEYKEPFDAMLDSFRVLQRPSRFGSIVMGALNGGIGSAMAYLLFAAIMKIIGLIRREPQSVALPPM